MCPKPHLHSLLSSNLTENWRTKKCNSSFTLQSKIHEFHQCPTAASEVRLQMLKNRDWGNDQATTNTAVKTLESYILLYHPALELLQCPAQIHEISYQRLHASSLFLTAWHFPRLYLLLYFPTPRMAGCWTWLQLGSRETYWTAYFLSLPQSADSVCTRYITW